MTAHRRSIARRGTATLPHVVLVGALPLAPTLVQDWYVDTSAPGCPGGSGTQADPFCTIQAAVDAALDGDTIHIAPGTYFENVVIEEDLSLIGTGGQEVTILDGMATGSVVQVTGSTVTLAGLTLTNGTGTPGWFMESGGGLWVYGDYLDNASASLANCTVTANSAAVGGGIYCYYGDLSLVDSEVSWNGGNFGAGISTGFYDHLTLRSSAVLGNVAICMGIESVGGVAAGSAEIVNSVIAQNSADDASCGLMAVAGVFGTSLTLTNSTIVDNTASSSSFPYESYAGGLGGWVSCGLHGCSGSSASVENCIFRNNVFNGMFSDFSQDGSWATSAHTTFSYASSPDPLFVDPVNGDYRLQPGSPCIDAGDNSAVPPGITTDKRGAPRFVDDPFTPDSGVGPGPVVDLGAFEFLRRFRDARGVPVSPAPPRSVP